MLSNFGSFSLCCLLVISLIRLSTSGPIPPQLLQKTSPVILVPGDGATQLWAKLNRTNSNHVYCEKKTSNYYLLWLDVKTFLYPIINCFVENIRLDFDNVTKTVHNPPGVDIEIFDWGNTSTVEYLSTLKLPQTSYFHYVVERLVNKLSYSRGESVRGTPFDFRLAPNGMPEFFYKFKLLIEETYSINENRSVTLLGHSLGCLYTHYFLTTQTQEWKDKYINSFISVSGPYLGAIMSLLAQMSGDNENISTVKPIWVREAQRSWPSTAVLMPTSAAWGSNEIIAMNNIRNYTVNDYELLFNDAKYPEGFDIWKSVANIANYSKPPGVRTFCIWSQGRKTADVLDWRDLNFPDDKPHIQFGDGDGTVNVRSLEHCSQWNGQQPQPVTTTILSGYEHLDIIRSNEFVDLVENIIMEIS